MKQLGSVVGNLADGYQDQGPAKTPGSERSTSSTTSSGEQGVDLTKMTREQAEQLVDRLLAGFPQLNLRDPDGYVAALVQVLMQYPSWAGEQAVLHRVCENPDFPPSDRRLRLWLADIVSPHRFVHEWNTKAKMQLAERKTIEDQRKDQQAGVSTEERGQIYDATQFAEAVAKYGRPIGVFETEGRKVPYRG